jgi:hypothetical protein
MSESMMPVITAPAITTAIAAHGHGAIITTSVSAAAGIDTGRTAANRPAVTPPVR